MLKIDNSLLEEIGLGALPEAEKNSFLKHIYETLEMRVGIRLADQMTNEQLDEFERYFEAKDDAGAFKWLETNFPNYKDIVQQEFDKLKAEVAQTAPQILAASQAQAGQIGTPPRQPVGKCRHRRHQHLSLCRSSNRQGYHSSYLRSRNNRINRNPNQHPSQHRNIRHSNHPPDLVCSSHSRPNTRRKRPKP